ncbi:hypothetical protein EIKCOROL_01643 [Eikenella corrodens ATCC 23834]|uniref:Uncharacterized protein n=1 Tax=Eikenella corrodens ATCC 23834 TaxID=546274 RepID=C0DW93_EIKCO|nr:hypothetical protein EIKCOROL_01643 [Eikenella corrodens ATCC 23834]
MRLPEKRKPFANQSSAHPIPSRFPALLFALKRQSVTIAPPFFS